MQKPKKEYIFPDLTIVSFSLANVICASPEYSNTVIDDSSGGGGWGGSDLDDDL